jgi:hypothetical protein
VASFYAPGGLYAKFAGSNGSRALAKISLDEKDAENTDMSDLTDKLMKVADHSE